jgi:hypothetical protein
MERKYLAFCFLMITSDRFMIFFSAIVSTASCNVVLFYNGVAFFEENKIEASDFFKSNSKAPAASVNTLMLVVLL